MKFLLSALLFTSGTMLAAQEFPDTIITSKGVLFACRVISFDEFNVFYKPAVLDKGTKKGRILKRDVASLALHSEVRPVGQIPMRHPYLGRQFEWREAEGIIYADLHDRAPKLGDGLVTINTLLERHVRATSRDHQVFGGAPVSLLLQLHIDQHGELKDVSIKEHATVENDQGTITRYIEDEIVSIVKQMRPWRPATTSGVNSPSMIYLPLRFVVNVNNIQMLPSKFTYSFKGRSQ
jgi:hypothetical protein